jgi:hypothetical protein
MHVGLKRNFQVMPGAVCLLRLLAVYAGAIWLSPQPEAVWEYHESIRITRQITGDRMFPLTLDGPTGE